MTISEATRNYPVSKTWVRQRIDDGRLAARKSGNVWLFKKSRFLELLESASTLDFRKGKRR